MHEVSQDDSLLSNSTVKLLRFLLYSGFLYHSGYYTSISRFHQLLPMFQGKQEIDAVFPLALPTNAHVVVVLSHQL